MNLLDKFNKEIRRPVKKDADGLTDEERRQIELARKEEMRNDLASAGFGRLRWS